MLICDASLFSSPRPKGLRKSTKSAKPATPKSSNGAEKPQPEVRSWPSRTSNRVNQHDSSSSIDLTSQSISSLTPNHSKESQASSRQTHSKESQYSFIQNLSKESQASSRQNHSKESASSGGSRSSLPALREVVGDGAIVFQYKDLHKATDGFSQSKKIGNSVYRGTIRGRMDVAISVHKKGEMYTDLVPKLKVVCSVHHSNVVSMIGACSAETGDYIYAVYPFLNVAKLRDCLRSVYSPGFCVLNTWVKRLQVAVDVAKGLEYLHESAHIPLVHKYVKSNNILLDSDTLRAKIAQFGIADLAGEVPPTPQFSRNSSSNIASSSEITEVAQIPASPSVVKPRLSRSRSRKLTGTRGYMAPEYMKSGVVTSKLDVFAFGVVLLELLSGQEAITYRPDSSIGNTLTRYTLFEAIQAIMEDQEPKNRLRQWMDPLLKDSYPLNLALKVAQLGKSCVDDNPASRPEMRSIAFDLSRIMMASEKWEASMMASKAMMSKTMEAR
ncbi:unnamed protein product [Calypogeia fissa]